MSHEENGLDRFAIVWGGRYRILGVAVVIALLTLIVCEILPATYQSTATISVQLPPQENEALSSTSITAVTSLAGQYADTATLTPVLQAAAPAAGATVTQLRDAVSAGTISGENLIAVRAQAPSPVDARRRANAVAAALTKTVNDSNASEAAAYSRSVNHALAPETSRINALEAQINDHTLSQGALASDESALTTLLDEQSTVLGSVIQGSAGEPNATVLSAATLGTQVQPRPLLYTLIALVVGLLIAAQLAILAAARRTPAAS